MITIKNKVAIRKMEEAGRLLAEIMHNVEAIIRPGTSTLSIDTWIAQAIAEREMVSQTKGFMGYNHFSCISINDEVVHGVPKAKKIVEIGDLVKVDICASWKGYCADAARSFIVGQANVEQQRLIRVAQRALDAGIEKARVGNKLSDISAAIQAVIEAEHFGIVRDFAGHGIGKSMHEEPEILNYGLPGKGPVLQAGMAFALEPMITMGDHAVYIAEDGWTVKTRDKSWAAHVEDTIVITEQGPKILTRK